MTTIKTKFDLGSQVWRIYSDTETIRLPCQFCRGKGWVRAEGAGEQVEQVQCPRHSSMAATVGLGSWPEWKVVETEMIIGSVEVRYFDHSQEREGDDGRRTGKSNRDNRWVREDEEKYMCWATGVGSGSVFRVDELFEDPEIAAEEAERRTRVARLGDVPAAGLRPWKPSYEQVGIAQGFLDHRDVYEHDAGHILLAEELVRVGNKR